MNHWLQKTPALLLSAGMLCAASWSVRLAYADFLVRGDSPAQIMRAIRLAPGNAAWWLRFSELADPDAVAFATQASPHNASLWIRAGLRAEAAGDRERAEQDLLRAAGASRQYQPRWTLANFYFRANDPERFWPWMKTALEWAPGDRMPLFRLCWKMNQDPAIVLARGIPDSSRVLREYLLFLVGTARLDASQPVAARLLGQASSADRPLLLAYTSRMLEARQWQPALSAWNTLCRRHVLPYTPLDAAHGSVVTNGDFQSEPLNAGFDWRPLAVDGIVTGLRANPSAFQIVFSGGQPESSASLSQVVPVAPGARYRFRCAYQTEGIAPENGLRWRIEDMGTGAEIASLPLNDAVPQEALAGSITFTVPPAASLVRLVLACRRPLGTTRIEGTLRLRHVALEPAP